MFSVKSLESLATVEILRLHIPFESLPIPVQNLTVELFQYDGRYILSSRTSAVFNYNGTRGKIQHRVDVTT